MLKTTYFGTLTEEELQDLLHEHTDEALQNDAPALYVGTYAKYNSGSLKGAWVDLSTFDSYEEFYEFCCLLHRDEHDPEFMFQDYENIPRSFYSESCCQEDIEKILELAHAKDPELARAYVEAFDDYDERKCQDRYMGYFEDEEAFARQIFDDCYDTQDIPEVLISYMDFEAFARDLFLDGYTFSNGYVFSDR